MYSVVCPAAQAWSSGSRSQSSACSGATIQTNEVPTTLVPARRNRVISASACMRAGLGLRGVDDAVGAQGDQRVDIVGGHDTGRFGDTAQLGGVAADLVGPVRVQADEFEVGALDDGAQRVYARRCRWRTG